MPASTSSSVERFDDKARNAFEHAGKTTVYRGELLRHPVYTRVLHWAVALFFFLALFTGFGIYLPWLFRWFTPFFGGGPLSRVMHPYFGVGFVFCFGLQALNWLKPMIWTAADSRWMRNIKGVVSGEEKMDPPDTGFFNAGQKDGGRDDLQMLDASVLNDALELFIFGQNTKEPPPFVLESVPHRCRSLGV